MTKKLNIHGIYYCTVPHNCYPDNIDFGKDETIWFIFYGSGFYLSNDRFQIETTKRPQDLPDSLNAYFIKHNLKYKDDINLWGCYVIKGDYIFLQEATGFGFQHSFQNHKAKIVNDTTFEFDKSFCVKDKSLSKTFNLIKSNKKPDSLNLFMVNPYVKKRLDAAYRKRHF